MAFSSRCSIFSLRLMNIPQTFSARNYAQLQCKQIYTADTLSLTSKKALKLKLKGVRRTFAASTQFSRTLSSSSKINVDVVNNIAEDVSPQGIQGDVGGGDCNFSLWLENCQRYGFTNCDEQLQGIQTGRLTLAEVIAAQDQLIADISAQYKKTHRPKVAESTKSDVSMQGVQDSLYAFPDGDMPCPQGVQGDDCAQFKLWLENCHRFGLHSCVQQLNSFKSGRKTLAQIFAEQDRIILDVVNTTNQQRRLYSTSPRVNTPEDGSKPGEKAEPTPPSEGQLTSKQKLQRVVKEYGTTVIVFHVSISIASLGLFYLLVSSGIDLVGLLQKAGIGGTMLESKLATGTGTFVVAYAVHKVFAPVRIGITATATPFIVRYLRRVGLLKMPQTPVGK